MRTETVTGTKTAKEPMKMRPVVTRTTRKTVIKTGT